jgi:hypothetical protein
MAVRRSPPTANRASSARAGSRGARRHRREHPGVAPTSDSRSAPAWTALSKLVRGRRVGRERLLVVRSGVHSLTVHEHPSQIDKASGLVARSERLRTASGRC